MSFGGGDSGTQFSEVKQTTSQLPEYAQPYWEDVMARGAYESSLPYEAYQGNRLAYFSPMEQQAMQGYGELGMSGTPPELDEAGRSAYGLMQGWDPGINTGPISSGYSGRDIRSGYNPDTRESGYFASEYDPSRNYLAEQREMGYTAGSLAEEGVLDPYMNPYYQNVVDVEKREAARQADMRHAATGLDAAGMGSLGGYREGIMRSEAERNLGYQMGDIQAKGSRDAFNQAISSFEADRSARGQEEQFGQSQFALNEQMRQREAELVQQGFSLNEASRMAQEQFGQSQYGMNQQALQASEQLKQSAFQASEQAKQEAARLGLTAKQIEQAGQIASAQILSQQDQSRLQATGMLGDFALQRQGMELERLGYMEQAGLRERGLAQQGLDMGYQDYLRQQGWGRESVNYLTSLLHGMPAAPGETTATYGPSPTAAQQLLGTGIAAAPLYNAFRGQ